MPTAFFRWGDLAPGASGHGPSVIAAGEATAVVPPGFAFRLDAFGNLVATRSEAP
jgi:N-methylhydantoinase A/oxoprolinase/acetone carboxylase beta subunit